MKTTLSFIITVLFYFLITKCSLFTIEIVGFTVVVTGLITIIISTIINVRNTNKLYRNTYAMRELLKKTHVNNKETQT
jgi:tetrahydromethanopterin S-methyltransferase subunit E